MTLDLLIEVLTVVFVVGLEVYGLVLLAKDDPYRAFVLFALGILLMQSLS